MINKWQAQKQTEDVIELLKPAFVARKGKHQAAWGSKTIEGMKASIFNILVATDIKHEKAGR